MKVLMIGPDRSVHGGISAMVNNYYAAGLENRVDLSYIGTMKEGSKLKKLLVAGYAYMRFAFGLHNVDIVHIHVASDMSFRRKAYFIRKAYKEKKRRRNGRGLGIIIHQHGGDYVNYHDNQVSDKTRQWMDEIINMADVLIVLTQSWKEYFSHIFPADKIEIVPNGVLCKPDSELCKPSVELCNPPIELYKLQYMHKLLFLGRICRDKGVNELLDAVAGLNKTTGDQYELYLAGNIEERTEDDKAIKCRIELPPSYVHYLGWLDNDAKHKLLSECGITILPSYFEGFPLTIIEAMSSGSIAIASEVGGIPEIITDHETGLLIPPRNAQAIIDAVTEIQNSPVLADHIRSCAYHEAVRRYSMENICNQLSDIYTNIMK